MTRRLWPLLLIPILVVWLAAPRGGEVGPFPPMVNEATNPDTASSRSGGQTPSALVPALPTSPLASHGYPARVSVDDTPRPTGGIGEPLSYCKPGYCETPQPRIVDGPSIAGTASWYRYIPGGAAAGPALRRFLGPHWRGGIVRVCAGETCIVAQLSDWCQCSTGAEKLIDLDAQLFAALAPLSQGIVNVEVRAIRD